MILPYFNKTILKYCKELSITKEKKQLHVYMLWFKSDLSSFYFLNLRSILHFTA